MHLDLITRQLRFSSPIHDVAFLDKGYSTDSKHVITTEAGDRYLLRISEIALIDTRRDEFRNIGELHGKGIRCPEAIQFGTSEEAGVCFMLLTYIDGECAEEALPLLSLGDQRQVGIESGEELYRIHHVLEPQGSVDDFAVRTAKYERNLQVFTDLGFAFEGQERAERYAQSNLDLLKGRPTVFRHGDYHPGNLIVEGSHLAGVIDFNRCDWGDPVDEFYKIAWFGAPLSSEYAWAHLRGYFGGEPPDDFWPLYNLYVAMVLPADLVWTHSLYPADLARSHALVEEIARVHDFDGGGPPMWWA
jgi:aminoglycoside phosphotransferase (APT) family kinase protein